MKNLLLVIFTLGIFSTTAWSQENMLTFSGGYTFANPEGSDENATGYRINGLYEYNPGEGKFAHGLNIGYIQNSYTETNTLGDTDYKYRNWATYYAPKIMLGTSEKIKPFLKGALGMHFSKYTSEGPALNIETNDAGFYGGVGLGIMYFVKSNVFLNLEYEWAYLSNSSFEDGFLNTAQLGIGFRL